jgi:serine/threonine protein kinase
MLHDTKDKSIMRCCLIDFGYCKKYLDKGNSHISHKEEVDSFRGNLMFASYEQMLFKKTSRKDDLVSLCYLMINLFNNSEYPGFDEFIDSQEKGFNII